MSDRAGLSLDSVKHGGKLVLARALAAIEERGNDDDIVALLDEAYAAPCACVVGLTGPPGVGKSTLINGLVGHWRQAGKSVGVLAIDPSSRVSGGALLGDRTRMTIAPGDEGVFFRSLAARGRLGGLSDLTFPAMVLMRALFDVVLIESVGVGQSEAEIVSVADTVVLCIQPGSGDSLQFMKAGIMEIPDIAVVTKADMEVAARRAHSDVEGALSLAMGRERPVPVMSVSATKHIGIDALIEEIDGHGNWLKEHSRLVSQRAAQADDWLKAALLADYGRLGLDALTGLLDGQTGIDPFARRKEAADLIQISLRDR